MTASETKKMQELVDKTEKLEALLNEILSQKAVITKITAGPFEHEGKMYYRTAEPGVAFWDGAKMFTKHKGDLKIGTEVLVINTIIADIMPEKLFVKEEPKNTFKHIEWSEIGGLKSQIERIRTAIELPLKNAKLAAEFGLEPIKGLLLYGPPGCGKTLIAKAIASMILKDAQLNDSSFVYIKGAELLSMYVGATEQRIIQMFKDARLYGKNTGKRAVIFIDEAEAILPARGSRISSDVDKTIVPTFLSEMDGFDSHSPIMILSTNLPDSLDKAILRPGRVDIKVGIERPTQEDVKEIFEIHLSRVKCAVDKAELAENGAKAIFNSKLKSEVSGAMVENMVKDAARLAMTRAMANPKAKTTGILVEDIIAV